MSHLTDEISTKLSDEELIRRVSQHDLEAYEALYDRHAGAIFNLLMRVMKNQQLAEDLLQETFWQVWQSASKYQGSGAAAAWLFRIARNRGLDELRRQRVRPGVSAIDISEIVENLHLDVERGTAETQPERVLHRKRIQAALDDLPPNQRICLEWAYFDGYTQREIAEIINVPVGTVKSRIRIGLEKLERLLRSAGFP